MVSFLTGARTRMNGLWEEDVTGRKKTAKSLEEAELSYSDGIYEAFEWGMRAFVQGSGLESGHVCSSCVTIAAVVPR